MRVLLEGRQDHCDLAGGGTCLLDAADPRSATWYSVLDTLRQAGLAAYIETDPKTNVVSRVLVARTLYVVAVAPKPVGNRHGVDLMISHAPHFIRTTNPDYQRLLIALIAAQQAGTPVLVTTEEPAEPAVIDVRPSPAGPPFMPAGPAASAPSTLAAAVTPQRAQELFNFVATQSCDVVSTSTTCIPFLYPDNGCWARAHEMCRLMIANGASPRKLWHYATGGLEVQTPNHPSCRVTWAHFHVAPIVEVETGTASEVRVIDPALFPDRCLSPVGSACRARRDRRRRNRRLLDDQVYNRGPTGASIEFDPRFRPDGLGSGRVPCPVGSTLHNPSPPGPPYNCP